MNVYYENGKELIALPVKRVDDHWVLPVIEVEGQEWKRIYRCCAIRKFGLEAVKAAISSARPWRRPLFEKTVTLT